MNLADRRAWVLAACRRAALPLLLLMSVWQSPSAFAVTLQPPTQLSLTAISQNQINVSWTASTSPSVTTYVIERCSGIGCTGFAQIATVSATSYSDTGLTPSTNYRYKIAATDGLGDYSNYTSAVGTSTLAIAPPTAPSASPVSTSQISLSWTASTTSIVTGYVIDRCSGSGCTPTTQIASVSGVSYTDTGLSPSTNYRYKVAAADGAGDLSNYTPAFGATTQAIGAPTNLTVSAASYQQINLTWTASTYPGVTYPIYRCTGSGCTPSMYLATVSGTSYSDTAVNPTTFYRYRLQATDAAGDVSNWTSMEGATTPAIPGATGLMAVAVSSSEIDLTWAVSTDPNVTTYIVYSCSGTDCTNFTQIAAFSGTGAYANTGLTPSTVYRYRVQAEDASGNLSKYDTTVGTRTLSGSSSGGSSSGGSSGSSSGSSSSGGSSSGSGSSGGSSGSSGGSSSGSSSGSGSGSGSGGSSGTGSSSGSTGGGSGGCSNGGSTSGSNSNGTTYTYDGCGHLIQVQTPGGATTTYMYDPAGHLISIQTTNP